MTLLSRRIVLAGGLSAVAAPTFVQGSWAQESWPRLAIDLDETDHVLTQVIVNGDTCQAGVDNGAHNTVLDLSFAKERRLISRDSVRVNGEAAPQSVPISVRLGPVEMKLRAPVIDLGVFLANARGEKPRLIVGRDLLARVQLMIDGDARWMEVAPHGEDMALPPGMEELPLNSLDRSQADGRHLMIAVEGGEPMPAQVDLGCSLPLIVQESAMTRGWREDGRGKTEILSYEMRGGRMAETTQMLCTARSLALGRAALADVPTQVVTSEDKPFGQFSATIGAPVLTRFRIFMDVNDRRLALKPGAAMRAPFTKSYAGLSTRQDGQRIRVLSVWPGGPAEAAGVARDDVIAAINDGPADRQRLRELRPGQRMTLRLEDGAMRTFVAREFY